MVDGCVDGMGADDGIAEDDDDEVVGRGTELVGMCMCGHDGCCVAFSAVDVRAG